MVLTVLVSSAALSGLVISAIFGFTVAILNMASGTKFILRSFRLDGATKGAQEKFLNGLRGGLTLYATLCAVMSAAAYLGMEVINSGAPMGFIAFMLGWVTLGAVAMVITRGIFMKKQVVAMNTRRKRR